MNAKSEAAWTLTGKWVGSGKLVKRPAKLDVEHNCLQEGEPRCGGTWICSMCTQHVPWCFVAAGDMPDVCDDCWYAHSKEARP